MTWLIWRQHRKQLAFGVATLLVLAGFFIATGIPIHNRFERMGLHQCLPDAIKATTVVDLAAGGDDIADTTGLDHATRDVSVCAQSARDFFGYYQSVIFAGLLLLILPMLAGMFWGAPLVAREVEQGTHRLVWTQGVSRGRWAFTKLALVSLAVMGMTAVYAAMLTWWIAPVMQTSGQRFAYIFFDIHGVVVFGYALFALALGAFAGAVTGRLLPAMATTVVGFVGVRVLVMMAARPRFLPTQSYPIPDTGLPGQMRNDLHGDWILASHAETTPVACPKPGGCFTTSEVLTVHPASQFWLFQAIETATFTLIALMLMAGTILWVRRRIP